MLPLIPVIVQAIQQGAPYAADLYKFFMERASASDIALLQSMLATDEMQKAIIQHELDILAGPPVGGPEAK